MASKLFATAALLALVAADGPGAQITNNCGFDVYYKPKGVPGQSPTTQKLESGGSGLNFDYPSQGGPGYSVLLSPDSDSVDMEQNVSQLEITYSASNSWTPSQIWYDLSNVNSTAAGMSTAVSTYPFAMWGFTLGSDQQEGCDSNPNDCSNCGCAAGVHDCQDAYQFWNDDQRAMHNCNADSSVQLALCKGFGDSSSSGSSGSSGSDTSGSDSYSSSSETEASSTSYAGYTAPSSSAAQQTTLATQYGASPSASAAPSYLQMSDFHHEEPAPSKTEGGDAVTVTDVVNAQVTDYVTAAPKHRRHEHIHRHAAHHHN